LVIIYSYTNDARTDESQIGIPSVLHIRPSTMEYTTHYGPYFDRSKASAHGISNKNRNIYMYFRRPE